GLGVKGTVVVEASAWLDDNQWVLDVAAANPVIVGLVGHLDPGKPEFRHHLARFAKNPLYRGIRLNEKAIAAGLGDKDFLQDMKRLADAGLVLDAIGVASMFPDLSKLAKRVSGLRIVIDHLPFYPQPGLQEMAAFPQIYAKVSGVLRKVGDKVPADLASYKPGLDEVWKVFGPDRLIYASNWPVSNRLAPYGTVLAVVREYFATKGADASDKYFWKNSLAAYQWVDRG
ncbi:MAG: amidohydrolase family protein, partial [Bryobacteraceae bacterium]